ncbi:putative C-type lectin domain family 20 member A [Platichthys flesus]|uniref:putative C-type lectin domain family 20 member A n=1 Tax=Platichthys flesus TaxID=8260 RepID=UPI002DB69364|nr:putative C-type lectin domain family 20 member A [Platichthys flesus]
MQILANLSVNLFKAPSHLQRPAAMEETLACLLLLLLSSSSEKYVYVDQRMSWLEAQTHCRTHYTDLAAVCSKQDTEHIQKLASKIDGFIWMGMEKFSTGGVKWMWSGGAEVTEFFWKEGQPENRTNEYSSLIQMDGWRDSHSHYSFPFFCFRVVVVRERKTWEDALDHCRELHLDLASINSETEMLLIQSELGKHVTSEHVWIGLHFFPDGWRWVDGRPLEYEAWREEIRPACPRLSMSCAALQVTGGAAALVDTTGGTGVSSTAAGVNQRVWKPHDCEDRLHFVCY